MKIFVGDLENCRAIELGSILTSQLFPSCSTIPMPTVLRFPALVQVNQEGKTPNHPNRISQIAVDMTIELSASRNNMVSTPLQVRIGQQLQIPVTSKESKEILRNAKTQPVENQHPEIHSRAQIDCLRLSSSCWTQFVSPGGAFRDDAVEQVFRNRLVETPNEEMVLLIGIRC